MRVAVLGDVHANFRALSAALATVDAAGYDRLIFLGDLLTYGADVEETVDLVSKRLLDGRAVLLRGNHDAIYRDLLDGGSSYANELPNWIRESICWTRERLPTSSWRELPFEDESTLEQVLFSHANPFGPEDWRYLNSKSDHSRAAAELHRRGFVVGVFGHTHRVKWFQLAGEDGAFFAHSHGVLHDGAVHVLNAGAIGQPRDAIERKPCVLWLDLGDGFEYGAPRQFSRQTFDYDLADHLRRVEHSGLSSDAVARIVRFFSESTAGFGQ